MASSGKVDPIVAKLRDVRRAREVSQDRFARASRMPQSTISEIETGARQPTIPTLRRYAAALGFDIVLKRREGPEVIG